MKEVKLQQGIRLISGIGLKSSTNGYTLYIPKMNISDIQQLKNEFDSNFEYENKIELAEELAYFLNKRFDQKGFPKAGESLNLEAALNLRKGVCKEMAAVYQILAQHYRLNSRYVRGTALRNGKRLRHAWNKVKVGKRLLYADATWGYFNDYKSALKEKDLDEGENIVEIPEDKDYKKTLNFITG